jgi:hypothetical protein
MKKALPKQTAQFEMNISSLILNLKLKLKQSTKITPNLRW